jgi:hypothetical protein
MINNLDLFEELQRATGNSFPGLYTGAGVLRFNPIYRKTHAQFYIIICFKIPVLRIQIREQVLFLLLIRDPDPGYGINISDHIYESLVSIYLG